ncbi:MAG: hypothetical protein I3273_04180 [Candidatus Moeniiplasma glomeromycotorum]|nr:hypothetical protein [Candidatus Moeniiplasma glomeromycotorum]
MTNKIISLYEHYKNTEKKLKIVCDWDEVIQACESFALWKVYTSIFQESKDYELVDTPFPKFFNNFWKGEMSEYVLFENLPQPIIKYSTYGSNSEVEGTRIKEMYEENKNSPNFYQETPFLTIAEDLLKLIREDKVDRLIFLSAYNKRKFPNGDQRKTGIFDQTFRNFWIQGLKHEKRLCWLELIGFENEQKGKSKAEIKLDELLKQHTAFITYKENDNLPNKILQAQTLITNKIVGENDRQVLKEAIKEVLNETDPQSKNEWIRKNAWDYDIFIDDNPNICESMVKYGNGKVEYCFSCIMETKHSIFGTPKNHLGCEKCWRSKVIAPRYPATENQHHKEVLLVKNEVSELKKEDFGKK